MIQLKWMRIWGGLLLVLVAPAYAEVFPAAEVREIREILGSIYDLNYRKAEFLCQRKIQSSPDDPVGYVYLARTYWSEELNKARELSIERFTSPDFFAPDSRYRVRVDPAAEDRFNRTTELAIEKAKARIEKNGNDLAARFLLGVAYQNRASFDFVFKRDWWSAVQNGAKNYSLHREVIRADPTFTDARLAIGVVTYTSALLSWKVRWLAFVLGYRGSKRTGIAELERVAKEGVIHADDARTVLAVLYSRDKNYAPALEKLREIWHAHPSNYLAHLEIAGLELAGNRTEAAIDTYQSVLKRKYPGVEQATVFNHLGVACRLMDDLTASGKWLRRAIADPRASERTITVARLELGKTLDLAGRREEALEQYAEVLKAPDVARSQREAAEWQKKPYVGR